MINRRVKRILKRQLDWTVYLIVRLAICFVQSVSMETCRQGTIVLSILFTDLFRVRWTLLKKNLKNAFPGITHRECKTLVRAMWEHLFLMVCEIAKAPRSLNELNWYKMVRLRNFDNLLNIVGSDRPLILVTGHFGNFEMGGFLLGLLGYPTFSVARTLDNPWLNQFIQSFRESTGQFLISKNEGYDEILDVLRNHGTIAFLADQSAGPKGCWIQFFNQPASAYKAMALLSLEYDAPIFVCHAIRAEGRPMYFEMEGIGYLDPRCRPKELTTPAQITQWFTSCLETSIRKHPDQYWWLHNRWKTFGRVPKAVSGREK